ncbi:hypothetical protein QF047_002119 [Arthrobacter sp. W4I7]|nr:hypothetical protein [Arthrobacter sp. W4I7]
MGRRDIHEGIHPSVPFLKETAPVTAGTAPANRDQTALGPKHVRTLRPAGSDLAWAGITKDAPCERIIADPEVMPLRSFASIDKWNFYRCLSF